MNKNEWIYWQGGECPVGVGTNVDVIHRDGAHYFKVKARISNDFDFAAEDWYHSNEVGDIVAYRLSEVEK
jgi:hypothetical protein